MALRKYELQGQQKSGGRFLVNKRVCAKANQLRKGPFIFIGLRQLSNKANKPWAGRVSRSSKTSAEMSFAPIDIHNLDFLTAPSAIDVVLEKERRLGKKLERSYLTQTFLAYKAPATLYYLKRSLLLHNTGWKPKS